MMVWLAPQLPPASCIGRQRAWCTTCAAARGHSQAAQAAAPPAAGMAFRLPDAHAHPQDDMVSAERMLASVRTSAVAAMGMREADWGNVLHLSQVEHLASATTAEGAAGEQQGSSSSIDAFAALCARRGGRASMFTLPNPPPEDLQGVVTTLLPVPPSITWATRLDELLRAHPQAVVGECGLDRAAVVPGTKVSVSLEHQVALVRHHLQLAARLQRPISMHCVRATGAMQDLLQSCPPDELPPRIMLHSFGGPPEAIRQLLRPSRGAGSTGGLSSRLWFSFSTTINLGGASASTSTGAGPSSRDKLLARIQAVPEDRLLIESDQNSVQVVDAGLDAILHLVAEARGWELQRAAEVSLRNFEAFYQGFLPPGWQPSLL